MALQGFGANVSMSAKDINVEIGESATSMFDFQGAATSFSGVGDTETTEGYGALAVEMREFYSKTFSGGAGTYGTRNSHTLYYAWTTSEMIQAAQNTSADGNSTYYIDDYIDSDLTNGDVVFLASTGTAKLNGGDNFYLDTTANKIAQVSSVGVVSNVRSRTPDTPTISENSVGTNSITINITGNTQVTNTYRIYVDGVSNSTKTNHTKGALANTNVATTHTITGLSDDTIYQIKVRGENTYANGSDSNTVNITTDVAAYSPIITFNNPTTGTGGLGLVDLTWSIDAYPALSSFKVESSLNSDMSSPSTLTTTNDGSEQYSVSGNAGQTIYFRITATNSAGTTVSAIKSATASSKPTINSFTGARSETVAGAVDLNWSTTAGTAATTAFSITRGTTLANAIGGTSVTTTNDGSEQATGIGLGVSNYYYMTITNANGTSNLYANSSAAITTRPAPTIDTFTAVTGNASGEIDITWTTTEADTITLYRDNGAGGAVNNVVNGLLNSTSVDSNTTETGLQISPALTYNFLLVADGVGSEQDTATDSAEPFAPPSFNHQGITVHNLSGTGGKFADKDTLTSNAAGAGGTPTFVNNRSGNVSITSNGVAQGESLQIAWSSQETTGYSSYANSHTNVNSSTIYYRVRWTEQDPGVVYNTLANSDGDNPIDATETITFSNGGVNSNVTVNVDFYNTIGTNPTGSGGGFP